VGGTGDNFQNSKAKAKASENLSSSYM
jgi:hypothetical protein